jgi:hypothetical protein
MKRVLAVAVAAVGFSATHAAAGDNPFLGTWKVAEAKVAPWIGASDPMPAANPQMRNATFTFAAASVTAPEPLGCAAAVYDVKTVGPEFLFEGGLTDPKAQARALGFTSDTFPALSFRCDRPDADVSMDYAMADNNTIVFALDNFIYTLKRTSVP